VTRADDDVATMAAGGSDPAGDGSCLAVGLGVPAHAARRTPRRRDAARRFAFIRSPPLVLRVEPPMRRLRRAVGGGSVALDHSTTAGRDPREAFGMKVEP
jgi:hypothetical protein